MKNREWYLEKKVHASEKLLFERVSETYRLIYLLSTLLEADEFKSINQ